MVFDVADGYELYFGGNANGSFSAATWTFSNGTWNNATGSVGTAPSARTGMGLAYDAADGYVLAVGGVSNTDGCGGPASGNCNDTWEFEGGKWTQLTPTYDPVCQMIDNEPYCTPFPGGSNPVAYDATSGNVVLFAGDANSPGFPTETWTYRADIWTQVNTTSQAPPETQDEGLTYDDATGQVILFGGTTPGTGGWFSLNSTWAFTGGTWSNLTARYPLAPAARSSFGFTYDSTSSLVVLFGGFWSRCVDIGVNSACLKGIDGLENDTWTFAANGWTNVTGISGPVARFSPAMADDPQIGGPLLFGGSYNGSTIRADLGDTWNWSSVTQKWNPINVPGVLVPPTITASPSPAVFGRPVQFGSIESGGATPYTYAWNFGDGGIGGNLSSITHTYTTNGPFLVVLTVHDLNGQMARGSLVISILLQAEIRASNLSGNPPLRVNFAGFAVGGTAPYNYSWNFDDGTPGTSGPITNHTFNRSGSYTVTLTVTDVKGLAVSTQVNIQAGPRSPIGLLGLPGADGYYVVAGAACGVTALLAAVTISRSRTPPSSPTQTETGFESAPKDDENPVKTLLPGEHDPAEDLV
jgi:PKD repeat protein